MTCKCGLLNSINKLVLLEDPRRQGLSSSTTTLETAYVRYDRHQISHCGLFCSQYNILMLSVIRLQCRYHAEPEPKVIWLFNGSQVHPSDHVTLSGNADQSALTINSTTLLDTGEYVCSVSNTLGQATTKTFLRVKSMSDYCNKLLMFMFVRLLCLRPACGSLSVTA